MADTNGVPALPDQVVMELQRHVAGLLGQLPDQLLQPFGLSPYLQKDNLTMSEKVPGTNERA